MHPRQRGITLIELIAVIGLAALLVGVFYTGVRYMSGADLREDTTQVAAVLRAAYNMATTTGKHHRVVFDLDEQKYRIEVCAEDMKLHFGEREQALSNRDRQALENLLKRGPQDGMAAQLMQAKSPAEATQAAAALIGTQVGGESCARAEFMTGDADQRGTERSIRTDRGIKIRSITVQHLEDERTEGVVEINFFPMGRSEKAVIQISDDDDNVYTLLLHALSGRVEFEDKAVDPNEHMFRRADGERTDDR